MWRHISLLIQNFHHAGTITKKWQFFKNDIVTQKIIENINDKILRLENLFFLINLTTFENKSDLTFFQNANFSHEIFRANGTLKRSTKRPSLIFCMLVSLFHF